jgi:hypothetical protein
MNPILIRILFVLFLLAHGWIHMSLAQVPVPQPGALRTPFFPAWWRGAIDPAWPVNRLGLAPESTRALGWVMWVAVVALYMLTSLAVLIFPGNQGLWQGLMVAGSAVSLAMLGLYWHPWLPAGVAIDLALIAGVLMRWPVLQFTA